VWHLLADRNVMAVSSLRSRLIYNSFDCRSYNINIFYIICTDYRVAPKSLHHLNKLHSVSALCTTYSILHDKQLIIQSKFTLHHHMLKYDDQDILMSKE